MTNYLPISQARLLQIQRETEKDESLQSLKAVIQQGWPDDKSALPPIVSPYFNMRDEMSVQDGLIFKGERVVVLLEANFSGEFTTHTWESMVALTDRASVFIGLA